MISLCVFSPAPNYFELEFSWIVFFFLYICIDSFCTPVWDTQKDLVSKNPERAEGGWRERGSNSYRAILEAGRAAALHVS